MIYKQLSRLDIIVYLRAIQSSRQNVNVSGSGFSVRNWSISSGLQPRDSIKASIQLVSVSISIYFAPRHSGQVSPLTVPVPSHSGQSQWVFIGLDSIRLLLILGKSSIALLVQFSNSGKMSIALTSSYLYTKRAKD